MNTPDLSEHYASQYTWPRFKALDLLSHRAVPHGDLHASVRRWLRTTGTAIQDGQLFRINDRGREVLAMMKARRAAK